VGIWTLLQNNIGQWGCGLKESNGIEILVLKSAFGLFDF